MAMKKVPTLLVGLGGIGCSIADMTSSMLDDATKEYVGIVGFDTNAEDLKKLSIKTVRTSDERYVKDLLREKPEYAQWFPINKFTVNKDMKNGAGQIRSISRLAGLAAEANHKFTPLKSEIQRIREHKTDVETESLNVFVVGSITGGTGAGLFLQIPYYIKSIVPMLNIHVRGMFLGPDVTKDVQPSSINRDAVMVNAYACLKELNAFYMTQITPDEDINLELDYYKRVNINDEVKKVTKDLIKTSSKDEFDFGYDDGIEDSLDLEAISADAKDIASDGANLPYDAFYLIEGADNKGTTGNSSLETIKKQMARMVHTILFSPVKAEAASTEDNLVLQDMEGGGMNRYSSAGLCSLVYPYEMAKQYVTLRWVKDLVKEEWLLIDKSYEEELDIAISDQKSDPSVKIPKLKDAYIRLFKDQISGKQGSRLGHLRGDAFTENPDDYNNPVSKASSLIAAIEGEVNNIFNAEDIKTLRDDCKLNMKKAMNLDTADKEVQRVYDALEELQRKIDSEVKARRNQIANEVFPMKESSLNSKKDSPLCMYNTFVNAHPVAVRFLCYDMIDQLTQKIDSLESGISSIDLTAYEDIDFYGTKEDGTQDANEAVNFIKAKNIPVLNTGKKPLNILVSKFQQMINNQLTLLEKYGKESLLLCTYKVLKERFTIMAEYQEGFFNNIEQAIKNNDEKIERIEKAYVKKPYGEIPVYASADAFKMIYQEFRVKAEFVLPEDTKESLFREVYRIVSNVLENKNKEFTEEQKRRRDAEIQDKLKDVFDLSIVKTLETIVMKKGKGIVDLNIKQAIEKELILKTGMIVTSTEELETERIAYAKELIEKAMDQANPMFAVDDKPDFTETVYLGINPESAEFAGSQADKGVTKDRLVPTPIAATDFKPVSVLMEKEFSPYEIICFRSKHKYLIEELKQYAKGSDCWAAYEKRINNLGKEPATEGIDAYKTVVNPHLNRYWHEEGFIPAIGVDERARAEEEVLKAFVYAMGMDLLKRVENPDYDDRLLWHLVHGSRLYPIRKKGVLIGNGYVDVLDALRFNRKIKKVIMLRAKYMKDDFKGHMDAEELQEKIMEAPFIEDLVQAEAYDDEGDENFLDILIKMFPNMPRHKWDDLFRGLSLTLGDFLGTMFGNNKKVMKGCYDRILIAMKEHSSIGKKKRLGQELTHAEKKTEGHIDDLIGTKML